MGTVVIHAGMPKSGSTSVQAWLTESATRLRERDVRILVVTTRHGSAPALRVAPYWLGGRLNSGAVVRLAREAPDARERLADDLCTQIDAYAEHGRTVVLTSEALAQIFWQGQAAFLESLDQLAGRHRVSVAYYVRPQHTALEAAWKQWGFRSGTSPAHYLETRSRQLHFLETYELVRRQAPRISFVPRPFRTDLLEGGDVVVDFARDFLGVDDPGETTGDPVTRARLALASLVPGAVAFRGGPDRRQNLGLPLDVANALSHAPLSLLGESAHDNRRFEVLKQLVARSGTEETEALRRSRALLHAYAFRTFEAGNRSMIAELGWATEGFIPPPDSSEVEEGQELARIDELWRPLASPAELELLYLALDRALPRRRVRRRATGRSRRSNVRSTTRRI